MSPDPLESFLFLNQLQISSAEKIRLTENVEIMPPPPPFKFLATPLPLWVVGEENPVIAFGPPHFRNASAIAVPDAVELKAYAVSEKHFCYDKQHLAWAIPMQIQLSWLRAPHA